MFVVILTYLVPLDQVDQHLVEHRKFLNEHYAAGHFLMSGPQNPRSGGVILVQGDDRDWVTAIMKKDPFQIHEVAKYQIIEFDPIKMNSFIRRALEESDPS